MKVFLLFLLFLLPSSSFAEETITLPPITITETRLPSGYTQLEPLPLGQGSPASNFGDYANQLFSIALALGGALAAVMLTIGGVQYMLSEAVGAKEEGRARIRNAILGIFLLFGTYLILDTINPNLVKFDLSQIGPVGAVINTRQVSLNRTVGPATFQTVTASGEIRIGDGADRASDPGGYTLTVITGISGGVPTFQSFYFSDAGGQTARARCEAAQNYGPVANLIARSNQLVPGDQNRPACISNSSSR